MPVLTPTAIFQRRQHWIPRPTTFGRPLPGFTYFYVLFIFFFILVPLGWKLLFILGFVVCVRDFSTIYFHLYREFISWVLNFDSFIDLWCHLTSITCKQWLIEYYTWVLCGFNRFVISYSLVHYVNWYQSQVQFRTPIG